MVHGNGMDLYRVRTRSYVSVLCKAGKTSYLLGLGCIGSSCGGRRGTLLYSKNSQYWLNFAFLYTIVISHLPISQVTGVKVYNVRFARKNSPEMFKASHRTTTIF